jgi:hypothetical protein
LCAGTYNVEVKDELELIDTLTIFIKEPDAFYVNLGNDTSICLGDSITFDAGTGYTYVWSPGGESSSHITAYSSGWYSVTATNEYSCSVVDSINLNLTNLPETNFSDIIMSNGLACNGSINGNVTGGNPYYSYLWSDDIERDSIHAINLCPGEYTLIVTDQNYCVATDTIEIKSNSLVNLSEFLLNFKVYPNPTSEFIQFKGVPEDAKVFVTDILGNVIVSELSNTIIDFTDFSSGTYLFNVIIEETIFVQKITVQK